MTFLLSTFHSLLSTFLSLLSTFLSLLLTFLSLLSTFGSSLSTFLAVGCLPLQSRTWPCPLPCYLLSPHTRAGGSKSAAPQRNPLTLPAGVAVRSATAHPSPRLPAFPSNRIESACHRPAGKVLTPHFILLACPLPLPYPPLLSG